VSYVLGRSSGRDNEGVTHQFVQIAFHSATGVFVVFLPLEFARKLGNDIVAESGKPDPALTVAKTIPNMNGMENFMKKIKGDGNA